MTALDTRSTAGRPQVTRSSVPTLRMERWLLRDGARLLAGMDEVGRGCARRAGHGGVVMVDLSPSRAPGGCATPSC